MGGVRAEVVEDVSGTIDQIQTGDYVTVRSEGGHGFLVTGWGPIVSCQTAVGTSDQPTDITWLLASLNGNDADFDGYDTYVTSPMPLFITHNEARQYNANNPSFDYLYVVPYVVDFPGAIDRPVGQAGIQLQRPRPRPFYCSAYDYPNHFVMNFWDSGYWRFYTFPNTVTIDLDQLYVSPTWEWTEGDKP